MSSPIEFNAPEPDHLSKLLDGYKVDGLIAKGGMGAVYHATQTSLDREVAIKVLPSEFGDEEFKEQFRSEAKAMAKLNHPNLIGIYDFGEAEGMPYIVMELVNGKSLYHSSYNKTIDQEEVARLICEICRGLDHAHEGGIIHRDIKPANILLNSKAEAKIGDFGLARPTEDKTTEDVIYGTPGYAAPEVINAPEKVGQKSDIFAVGVMLYELLTNKLPGEKYRPPSQLCGCDPRFDNIVRRATHPSPGLRYATAGELAKDIEKIRSSLKKGAAIAMAPRKGEEPRQAAALATGDAAEDAFENAPAPLPENSSSSPVARNVAIIAILGVVLFFAWEGYQKKKEETERKQAEIDRKYQEEMDKKNKKKEAQTKTKQYRQRHSLQYPNQADPADST